MAASISETAAVNHKGTKMLLSDEVTTFLINGKPTCINGLRKSRNPPSWIIIFLVVSFNKILLFSKHAITFMTSFTSLFVSVSLEPLSFEIPFLNILIRISTPEFPRM